MDQQTRNCYEPIDDIRLPRHLYTTFQKSFLTSEASAEQSVWKHFPCVLEVLVVNESDFQLVSGLQPCHDPGSPLSDSVDPTQEWYVQFSAFYWSRNLCIRDVYRDFLNKVFRKQLTSCFFGFLAMMFIRLFLSASLSFASLFYFQV